MSDVDRIYRQFTERHRSGEGPEPLEFLGQVDGTDRAELAVLIAAFLEQAPRRPWDSERYAGSSAQRAVEAATAETVGERLRRSRDAAKLRRDEVVDRLGDALGLPREEKVRHYYHQLETGLLDPAAVSSKVYTALGTVFGTDAEGLRRSPAGERAPGRADSAEVFARRSLPDAQYGMTDATEAYEPPAAPSGPPPPSARERGEWDEIDRLFLGGE